MRKVFPVRSKSHQLEELSERFLRTQLPTHWTCERLGPDYGIDLRVDIYEGHFATGLELLIQLKASQKSSAGKSVTVRLQTSTYNYLKNKLQIAMLVKFVRQNSEAYWLLVRDIPPPNQDNKTFSVRIPRTNKLSTIDWVEVQRYVASVTDAKLAAMRRKHIRLHDAQ
jgi:hypothetical protein